MNRSDEELTKAKSKDALGVGGPPPQPMSFEDTWDTKSPCRTVQSQSPGKVAFETHRKSTDYSSDNMQPRTPYGGGLMPQPHQDFDPWKKEEKFLEQRHQTPIAPCMPRTNKKCSSELTKEAWVIIPTMGSTVVLKTRIGSTNTQLSTSSRNTRSDGVAYDTPSIKNGFSL